LYKFFDTMSLAQTYVQQLQAVAAGNKKILERLPEDKLEWRPHEKSMTLGRLAMHLAELPLWVNRLLESDGFDFASIVYKPNLPENKEQILAEYDNRLAAAVDALSKATDEELQKNWNLRRGDHVIYDLPRTAILHREQQHMVHHRGQLSVYLRLLDVPVPGMFGPSADER